MSQEKEAARHKAIGNTAHEFSLFLGVEIDHHISTEDNVQTSKPVVVFEIVVVEYHTAAY